VSEQLNKEESSSPAEEERFNYIYAKLVTEPNDFVGLCAYSIYKQEKIDYIIKWKEKNGRDPKPYELQDFHTQSMNRCEQYRMIAVQRVEIFSEEILAEKIADIEEFYKDEAISKSRFAWWNGVWQSLTASVIFSFVIGIILVILIGVKFGFVRIFELIIEMIQ
jgi:hypothetical protein